MLLHAEEKLVRSRITIRDITVCIESLRRYSWYAQGVLEDDELQCVVSRCDLNLCGGKAGTIEEYSKVTSYRVEFYVTN